MRLPSGILIASVAGTLLFLGACGGPSRSGVEAVVYIGGKIEGVNEQEVVITNDVGGNRVNIALEEAEGPAAQFCRQKTTPNYCAVLSEAAPKAGERVCVLARLDEDSLLTAWKVFLESDCRHVP